MIFQWFQVSGFRCQHLAPLFPDTRHLTPKFFELRCSCSVGAPFSERSLGKSLDCLSGSKSFMNGIKCQADLLRIPNHPVGGFLFFKERLKGIMGF